MCDRENSSDGGKDETSDTVPKKRKLQTVQSGQGQQQKSIKSFFSANGELIYR